MIKYFVWFGLSLALLGIMACGDSQQAQQAPNSDSSAMPQIGPMPGEDDELSHPFTDQSTQAENLLAAEDTIIAARTGDMDSMKEWRAIRILTVYSTGQYRTHQGKLEQVFGIAIHIGAKIKHPGVSGH